jgi:hypothetical protein
MKLSSSAGPRRAKNRCVSLVVSPFTHYPIMETPPQFSNKHRLKWSFPRFLEIAWSDHVMTVWPNKCLDFLCLQISLTFIFRGNLGMAHFKLSFLPFSACVCMTINNVRGNRRVHFTYKTYFQQKIFPSVYYLWDCLSYPWPSRWQIERLVGASWKTDSAWKTELHVSALKCMSHTNNKNVIWKV